MLNSAGKYALLSILALSASACVGAFNGQQHAMTVAEEHPISVDSQTVTLTIDADETTTDLSDMDKARLRAFADAYMNNGHGVLTITAPSGTDQDFDGQEMASDIRKALNEAGVPWSALTGATYRTGGDANGNKIIASYTHYIATPSACGDWTGGMNRKYRNLRSKNFGCSSMNNLAVLLADPHDLVAPAGITPRDAAVAVRGFQAYREGEVKVSDIDSEISTEVSGGQ
jgi:pilus assembly protein CpaD